MKKISIFCLIIFLLINCRKNDESDFVNDLNLTTIPGWRTIDFKTNYTIQVPEGFLGLGMTGFEGNTFYKSSADRKFVIFYGYSNSLFCSDFGDTLPNPVPRSVQARNFSSQLLTLDHSENFYQDSQIIGVLYYLNADHSWGRLFWKDGDIFKDALEIDFNLTELETVNKIIQSIKRK